jgi:hypothetical protein
MRRLAAIVVFSAAASSATAQDIECKVGPSNVEIGGNQWDVFACSDGASIAVVSDAESPAHPFYFVLMVGNETISLKGGGNGNKDATKTAFDELSVLNLAEVGALFHQATASGRPQKN